MPSLFIPPRVARELAGKTLKFREDVFKSILLDDSDPILREFTQQLQRIDPRIVMVRANMHPEPGVPMRPGFYHLLIDNGLSVPITVTPITGEDGGFAEPTSRVFERLLGGDMHDRRNLERFARVERERFEAVEREKARDREERIEHRRDLVNAYTRTSVSTTKAAPWRQNQAGHEHGGRRHLRVVE